MKTTSPGLFHLSQRNSQLDGRKMLRNPFHDRRSWLYKKGRKSAYEKDLIKVKSRFNITGLWSWLYKLQTVAHNNQHKNVNVWSFIVLTFQTSYFTSVIFALCSDVTTLLCRKKSTRIIKWNAMFQLSQEWLIHSCFILNMTWMFEQPGLYGRTMIWLLERGWSLQGRRKGPCRSQACLPDWKPLSPSQVPCCSLFISAFLNEFITLWGSVLPECNVLPPLSAWRASIESTFIILTFR